MVDEWKARGCATWHGSSPSRAACGAPEEIQARVHMAHEWTRRDHLGAHHRFLLRSEIVTRFVSLSGTLQIPLGLRGNRAGILSLANVRQRRVLVGQSSSRTSRLLGLTNFMDFDRISARWLTALLTS